MRHALAILTYRPAGNSEVDERLYNCLSRLQETGYPGPVYIIDDGSPDRTINCDWAKVIMRPTNGGISRAKNTCLRVLSECPIDVGFLAEDDTIFLDKWWIPYLEAHDKTAIHHFTWAWDEKNGQVRTPTMVNGYQVDKHNRLCGVFLTFTPTVIERVGGFLPMPCAWGYEHINWTRRIVAAGLSPGLCDIPNSNNYIKLADSPSTVSNRLKREGEQLNKPIADNIDQIYWAIDE